MEAKNKDREWKWDVRFHGRDPINRNTGRQHNNQAAPPLSEDSLPFPGFVDPDACQPYNRGFSEVFIHGAGGIGQGYPGSCADFPPNRKRDGLYFDNVFLHNDTIVQTKGICSDVFFRAAPDWEEPEL